MPHSTFSRAFTHTAHSIALIVVLAFATLALTSAPAHAAEKKKNGSSKKYGKFTKVKAKAAPPIADFGADGGPNLLSHAAMVFDQSTGMPIYTKNADSAIPIASITKLMTAIVVLEAKQNLNDVLLIDAMDVDSIKNSRSRLPVGTAFRREDLMRVALLASDNRAAAALGRNYPGGTDVFVATMNMKARALGLTQTVFVEPTGLAPGNVSTPHELAILVAEASRHDKIREFSTAPALQVTLPETGRQLGYNNTNLLVRSSDWDIGVSKTGYINEAGKCLVMQAVIASKPVIIVLMDSWGRYARVGDANRIKKWLEHGKVARAPHSGKA